MSWKDELRKKDKIPRLYGRRPTASQLKRLKDGPYFQYTNDEMKEIRRREERKKRRETPAV